MNRAVFLDRDGVLLEDVHLLTRIDQISIPETSYLGVRMLGQSSFKRIVVTNQTVVSRGLASLNDVETVNSRMNALYLEHTGIGFHRFYVCPHHPNADLPEFRSNCECRKPKPGMLLEAATEFELSLTDSWVIGDRISDIVAGHRAGCRTILLETGKHNESPIESDGYVERVTPDFIRPNLLQAVSVILEEAQS